jgi:uncharacterized RDD family membrane protein YckC
LRLELGSAGARAGAFLLDALLMILILTVMTIGLFYLGGAGGPEAVGILWLIGFFLLRNGWFALFEMGSRGATPGKRTMGLRVIARDGARLTGAAVIARNAMREIEVFLPLSFLATRAADGSADTFLVIFSLLWSGIFLFFPLFNRDRLRIGDLVAGTWVVRTKDVTAFTDLVGVRETSGRKFPAAALEVYGVYELQTLEDVLRNGRPEAIETAARAIRGKTGLPDEHDDHAFLSDYYAALCQRLEAGLMIGRRRENKWQAQ